MQIVPPTFFKYFSKRSNIQTYFLFLGETLIADNDSVCPPKPPSMFPLLYQNSSASSGLGSADEITYAPIMTSTSYAPNMIYEGAAKDDFSTFRPPPLAATSIDISLISGNTELASFYPNYANQQQYSSFESEEDEGVMSAATLTPAEDYSKQYGELMESSCL